MTLAIVQAGAGAAGVLPPSDTNVGGTCSLEWSTTPISGNLLIAVAHVLDANGAPSTPAGWTSLDTSSYVSPIGGSDVMDVNVIYKYAGGSESLTPTLDGNARQAWFAVGWEISGVTGTITTDVKGVHFGPAVSTSTSGAVTTTSFNLAAANETILLSYGGPSFPCTVTSAKGSQDTNYWPSGGGTGIVYGGGITAFHDSSPGGSGSAYTDLISYLMSPTGASAHFPVLIELAAFVINETVTASLALAGVGFRSTPQVIEETIHASLGLSGVAIQAGVLDLGVAGAGTTSFSTFGA